MKRNLADKDLAECRGKCNDEVKKYEKIVSYGITMDNQRTENLWNKCKQLQADSEELKGVISNLNGRLSCLENVLGYYNGSEIVSQY